MMLILHADAEAELAKIIETLESQSPQLSEQFAITYRSTLIQIQENPQGFSRAEDAPRSMEIRYAVVGRFKYRVIDAQSKQGVVILAVTHLHRRPGYWRRRLKDLN